MKVSRPEATSERRAPTHTIFLSLLLIGRELRMKEPIRIDIAGTLHSEL